LLAANLKMLVRNRQALFWALAFPLIFVISFGLFDLDNLPDSEVGVIDRSQDDVSRRIISGLGAIDTISVRLRTDEARARKEVVDRNLEVLLIIPPGLEAATAAGSPARIELAYDEGRATAVSAIGTIQRYLDQVNLQLAAAPSVFRLDVQGIRTEETDYFDFLLPGFVGMGVMTFSIISIASTLALYRQQNIFKRILATPLRVRTFSSAMVIAHLLVALVQAAIILGAGVLFLDGSVHGNLLYLAILVILGNLIFLSIGFVVGAYSTTVAAASGLGNVVTLPMMFLSGTFFPLEDLPKGLSEATQFLPLAPMLEAMRGVALDDKSLWDFPGELALLGGWIAVMALIATRVFKFR
jgi:ABC-2 type transport system permease protein